MLKATTNEPVPLQVFVSDGRTDLFVRVQVLDVEGSLVTTLDLEHLTSGLYSVNWTPGVEGYFTALYAIYTDDDYSILGDYDADAELIDVNSDKTNILRLLGLAHENAVLDNQTYSAGGQLTTARLRAYDTAAHAALAGVTGLRFTWTVAATYDLQGRATSFAISRVP